MINKHQPTDKILPGVVQFDDIVDLAPSSSRRSLARVLPVLFSFFKSCFVLGSFWHDKFVDFLLTIDLFEVNGWIIRICQRFLSLIQPDGKIRVLVLKKNVLLNAGQKS
jgi:hypothetical protein